MSILGAILLGLVQGVTEFIPVSSSGHIILAKGLFGIDSTFEFDVLLNIGTLVALILFYRHYLAKIIRDFISGDRRVGYLLIIATIPAVVIGYALGDIIENALQSEGVVVVMLFVVGYLMINWQERKFRPKTIQNLPYKSALKIGIAQAVALIPGTSRSGITILAASYYGMKRREAAQLSFLMAIPVITGAVLRVGLSSRGIDFVTNNFAVVFFGNVASFAAGYLAIRWMLSILGKEGLRPFGWYRIWLGSFILVLMLFGRL